MKHRLSKFKDREHIRVFYVGPLLVAAKVQPNGVWHSVAERYC